MPSVLTLHSGDWKTTKRSSWSYEDESEAFGYAQTRLLGKRIMDGIEYEVFDTIAESDQGSYGWFVAVPVGENIKLTYRHLPKYNELYNRIADKDYIKDEGVYVMLVNTFDSLVVELAITGFMNEKYIKQVYIDELSSSNKNGMTHKVVFFSYKALYDFMKALLKMNQKDAEIMLEDLLLDLGYSWDTGTW